jgi:hypothetical protein
MSNSPLIPGTAPSDSDLAEVYRESDAGSAGRRAEAVLASPNEIFLLATDDGAEGEQTALVSLAGDGTVVQEWRYPASEGAGRGFARRADASFVIAGDLRRAASAYQAHLLAVDRAGSVVTQRAFGPLGPTGLVSIVSLSSGLMIAAGTANWKGWLVRVDETSESSIPLPESNDVFGVCTRADGGFAAASVFEASTTSLGRARIMAWSADCAEDWRANLPASGRGELTGLVELRDGSLVGIGHIEAPGRKPTQIWVVCIDSRGTPSWERSLGSHRFEHRGRAISLMGDGGFAIAGDYIEDDIRRPYLARLDANGDLLWEHLDGGADRQLVVRGIAATPGGIVIVGSIQLSDQKTAAWISEFDMDGRARWGRTIPAPQR